MTPTLISPVASHLAAWLRDREHAARRRRRRSSRGAQAQRRSQAVVGRVVLDEHASHCIRLDQRRHILKLKHG